MNAERVKHLDLLAAEIEDGAQESAFPPIHEQDRWPWIA
jgi:hypothetical protein